MHRGLKGQSGFAVMHRLFGGILLILDRKVGLNCLKLECDSYEMTSKSKYM